jgi:hypothetical protein
MAGKANTPPYISDMYYHLPESARVELGRVRDELDLFAELIFRIGGHDESLLAFSASLSHYFADMSEGITDVLDACLASADHAATVSRSRH